MPLVTIEALPGSKQDQKVLLEQYFLRRIIAQKESVPEAKDQVSLEMKAELMSLNLQIPSPPLDLGWQMNSQEVIAMKFIFVKPPVHQNFLVTTSSSLQRETSNLKVAIL